MKKYILILLLACSLGVNAQYNLFARQNFEAKKSTFSYVLDAYPNAAIAYSFRKLRSAYTGYCIKVRRSSDNTTLDIGFVNNLLDESSLNAFVGAGDGFIQIWYDQSGNVNNSVQSTTANQPQIVISGVLIKKAGKPAFYSPKTAQMATGLIVSVYDSAFTVFQIETTGNDGTFLIPFTTAENTGGRNYGICSSGSGAASYDGWAIPAVYKNNSSLLTNTRGVYFSNFVTGAICLLSEFAPCSFSNNRGLAHPVGSLRCVSYVQEHITYNSDQNSNKTGIENNINAFYSIY